MNSIEKVVSDWLTEQFKYYNFEITGPAKTLIDSIANDVFYLIDNSEDDDEELCNKDYYKYELIELNNSTDFPSDTECYAIISKALKNDSSHFEYITEHYDLSITGQNCLVAEWKYNILPDLLNLILDIVDNDELLNGPN